MHACMHTHRLIGVSTSNTSITSHTDKLGALRVGVGGRAGGHTHDKWGSERVSGDVYTDRHRHRHTDTGTGTGTGAQTQTETY